MSNKKQKHTKIESNVNYYRLTANKKQLETISLALDIFSRLQNGQIDWCFSMIPWKQSKNLKSVEPMLSQIKEALIGMSDGYLGIGNVSEQARVAYDIHQLIRYELHRKNLDEKAQTIFDEPNQYSNEPLPTLDKVEGDDEL